MGIFDGISGVKASQDASYLQPGEYAAHIDRIKQDESRKGHTFVAIEMTILKVLRVEKNDEGQDISNQEGDSATYMLTNGGPGKDMFLPNIKRFVKEIMGCADSEVGPAECEAMVGEDQPLSGFVVRVRGKAIVTRSNSDFTKTTFCEVYPREVAIDEMGLKVPEGAKFLEDIEEEDEDSE